LRRGWSAWQQDLTHLLAFARENDFEWIDFGPAPPEELGRATQAGLKVGSADLKHWKEMLSPDPAVRQSAVAANFDYVRSVAPLGVKLFLTVLAPEDPARSRAENFEFAVDSYGRLARAISPTGARVVIEGAPGRAPPYASLGCTPADCRALFRAVADRFGDEADAVLGLNFDPSHLVRAGIDPLRFAREFAPRTYHAHAKDTALLENDCYEHGNLQPATFASRHGFGGYHWRYALPGRGAVRWGELLGVMRDVRYGGILSIELEDEQFNGSEAGEKQGFVFARDFLTSV
jgi:sugar phosphate isomerase/epimerase